MLKGMPLRVERAPISSVMRRKSPGRATPRMRATKSQRSMVGNQSSAYEVRVKGQPVPAGSIQRFASLVLVHAALAAGDAYEVRLGDRVIGSGVGP